MVMIVVMSDKLEPQPAEINRTLATYHDIACDNRASILGFAHSAAIWEIQGWSLTQRHLHVGYIWMRCRA